jgi:hypothetical protein
MTTSKMVTTRTAPTQSKSRTGISSANKHEESQEGRLRRYKWGAEDDFVGKFLREPRFNTGSQVIIIPSRILERTGKDEGTFHFLGEFDGRLALVCQGRDIRTLLD